MYRNSTYTNPATCNIHFWRIRWLRNDKYWRDFDSSKTVFLRRCFNDTSHKTSHYRVRLRRHWYNGCNTIDVFVRTTDSVNWTTTANIHIFIWCCANGNRCSSCNDIVWFWTNGAANYRRTFRTTAASCDINIYSILVWDVDGSATTCQYTSNTTTRPNINT